MTAENEGVVERLRKRAAAFNDAGLRYGVADLLNEAADAHDALLDRLRTAEAEVLELHNHFGIQEGRTRDAMDRAAAAEVRAAEAEKILLGGLGKSWRGVVDEAILVLRGGRHE